MSGDDIRELPITETPDPQRVQGIQRAIKEQWRPVRPRPSDWVLTSLLLLLFLAFVLTGASAVREYALRVLTPLQMILYYALIAICALAASIALVQRAIPGAKRRLNPGLTMLFSSALLVCVALLLFRNFDTSHFALGVHCMRLGAVCALISGVLFALVLRNGLFRSPVDAAIGIGFFSGVAGVAVLALHCPVLTFPHIVVWHFGVLGIGIAGGALAGVLWQTAIQRARVARSTAAFKSTL